MRGTKTKTQFLAKWRLYICSGTVMLFFPFSRTVPEEERGDHDPERLQEQRLLQRILGESPVYDDLPSVVSSDTCSLRVTNGA